MAKPKPIPAETGLIRTRVRKDGTTAYRAVWDVKTDGDWRQASRTFERLEDAQAHLADVARAKRSDRYRGPSRLTVNELVAEYVARAEQSKRITAGSAHTYRERAARMIAPTIGARRLDGLEPLDVQRWIDALVARGFAASTIHPAVAVLMGALREAALLGITDRHRGLGVRRPAIDRTPKPVWSVADVRRVLAAVAGDPIYDALYHVAIATGMRPGELRALAWRDVNLDAGIVAVRRTMAKDADGRAIIAERTKGKQARAVAIAPATVDALRRHRALQNERRLRAEAWHDLDLVFDRDDGKWLVQSTWFKRHNALCARAGVRRIRLHDLRHTSASLELETGTHPKVVSDRLGHAKISMTLDMYSHVSPALQRAAANALSDFVLRDEGEQAG